jgi:hypothetical protein
VHGFVPPGDQQHEKIEIPGDERHLAPVAEEEPSLWRQRKITEAISSHDGQSVSRAIVSDPAV